MSGEDLTCQAGLGVQQDTLLATSLGVQHIERNGHHYVKGFGIAPINEASNFANAHADLYEMNICPHNYNGHLSTFISLQFCSIVPNLRIAEVDLDDVPWRDELFTSVPLIENGDFKLTKLPGWGCDLNEDIALKFKWNK